MIDSENIKYKPLCLKVKLIDNACRNCLLLKTNHCDEYKTTLNNIYKQFNCKFWDLDDNDKSDIFTDLYFKVIKRVEKEEQNPIDKLQALMWKIYHGVIADYWQNNKKQGITGIGIKKPQDIGISVISLSDNNEESDLTIIDKETMKVYCQPQSSETDRIDDAISYLEKMATTRARKCIKIFLCLKEKILVGGEQKDCVELLMYSSENSLNVAIKRCRKLLERMD